MNKRLVIVVLFTLYLHPVAAVDPVMDVSLSLTLMEQFRTNLDGTLRCIECALSYWECMCALSQSSLSPSYIQASSNESSFYDTSAHAYNAAPTDLSGVLEYVNGFDQPLIESTIQSVNTDATTVQLSTVGAPVDDVHGPGLWQPTMSPMPSPCSRRHAPRKDGFACTVDGCNKTFDRNCELNRHFKVHLSRNERPHKCPACGEGFLYPKDLIRHRRKHEKQASAKITYFCHIEGCPNIEGFSRRDNLLRHQRRQHEGTASPPA